MLVIADLHFGIEAELAQRGVHIPSRSRERLERACHCIREADADLLLLLGDVKHGVPRTSRQEWRELPRVLAAFRELLPIRIAPGNHDTGIERFVAEGELLPVRGGEVDGVWYMHGHTYPAPECRGKLLVVGHHHPMVALRDEIGCALYDRAYVLGQAGTVCLGLGGKDGGKDGADSAVEKLRVLFMPAFNELSGFDVLKLKDSDLGPVSRCTEMESAEVFLTDGTFVGTVGRIRGEPEDPA